MTPLLSLRDVSEPFDAVAILGGVSIDATEGEVAAIVGGNRSGNQP